MCSEQDKFLQENSRFRMVGIDFVRPDITLGELGSQAAYVETASDISPLGIRTELKAPFNVISSVMCKLVLTLFLNFMFSST